MKCKLMLVGALVLVVGIGCLIGPDGPARQGFAQAAAGQSDSEGDAEAALKKLEEIGDLITDAAIKCAEKETTPDKLRNEYLLGITLALCEVKAMFPDVWGYSFKDWYNSFFIVNMHLRFARDEIPTSEDDDRSKVKLLTDLANMEKEKKRIEEMLPEVEGGAIDPPASARKPGADMPRFSREGNPQAVLGELNRMNKLSNEARIAYGEGMSGIEVDALYLHRIEIAKSCALDYFPYILSLSFDYCYDRFSAIDRYLIDACFMVYDDDPDRATIISLLEQVRQEKDRLEGLLRFIASLTAEAKLERLEQLQRESADEIKALKEALARTDPCPPVEEEKEEPEPEETQAAPDEAAEPPLDSPEESDIAVDPTARFECPETVVVGRAEVFDGTTSSDPDGRIVSYSWDFGDNTTAKGAVVRHVYRRDRPFTICLTVTDDDGAVGTVCCQVKVIRRGTTGGTPGGTPGASDPGPPDTL